MSELLQNNPDTPGIDFKHPGKRMVLHPGLKEEIITPNIPNPEYFPLDTTIAREICALFGTSLEVVLLDASEPNFSSMRMTMEISKVMFRYIQNFVLAAQFLDPWWNFKIKSLAQTEKELARSVKRYGYDPLIVKWDPPGWHGLDPEKDLQCDDRRMSNGHSSMSRVYQERGLNFSREAPRMILDAAWLMQLQMEAAVTPEMIKAAKQLGMTPREVFLMLRSVTTPGGPQGLKTAEKIATEKGKELLLASNEKEE